MNTTTTTMMGANLLPPGGGHHHQNLPAADFLSTMPIMTSMGLSSSSSSEIFNSNFDPSKNLLINTLPMATTTSSFMKPMNMMVGGMFSGSSGTLFGTPNNNSNNNKSTPSSYLQEMSTFSGSSAQMSATALLQKAAQMGAAPTSSHTSSTMQKSFVGMPAPAQADQGGGMNGGIFMGHLFDLAGGNGNGNGNNNNNDDMGMVLGRGEEDIMNDIISSRISAAAGGINGTDVMMQTVDFLGIGGSRPSKNLLHEQQQQQRIQQLEEISQQRMQVIMDPFRHHDDQQMSSSHRDQPPAAGATEKPPLWDV